LPCLTSQARSASLIPRGYRYLPCTRTRAEVSPQ
jgi:hypothetical protein